MLLCFFAQSSLLISVGCSSDDVESGDEDVEESTDDDDSEEEVIEEAPVYLIGGEEADAFVEAIYTPAVANEATDLAFHPERDELWVVNRDFEVDGTCSVSNPFSERCENLGGYVTIIFEPGTDNQNEIILEDGNSTHFMRRPPTLAMGVADTFATCGEAATGNFEDEPVNFIGPTLWSSNLNIFAKDPGVDENGAPLNGSHLDMLHGTPWCMGIAHQQGNTYWAFNGDIGAIDRYDFAADHGPGYHDHSDGRIYRFAPGEFSRVENVPSHMVYNHDDDHLYIADTGSSRVRKLDATSGTFVSGIFPLYEELADSRTYSNVDIQTVVDDDVLDLPSGLVIYDDVLYVGDHATGEIIAFDLDGEELHRFDTGLGADALTGLEIGPNGQLWFTNMLTGSVYHIVVE